MLPQRQTTVGSSTTWMWPTSPALPWAPRWRWPSEMIPAPMPVPTFTTTTLSWPAAMPERHSPSARRLTSLSTQTGRAVARGEPLADRIAVPAGHDRRRDRPAGLELDRPRDADADRPTAGPGRPASSAAATRTGRRPGRGKRPGRPRSWPARRDGRGSRPSRLVTATSMLVAPRSATSTWPASARNASWRGGRPPVLGPRSPSMTSPRSTSSPTRCATIARPRPGPGDELGARPRPAETDLVEHGDQGVQRLVGERQRAACGSMTRAMIRGSSSVRRLTFALDRSKYDRGCGEPDVDPSSRSSPR